MAGEELDSLKVQAQTLATDTPARKAQWEQVQENCSV